MHIHACTSQNNPYSRIPKIIFEPNLDLQDQNTCRQKNTKKLFFRVTIFLWGGVAYFSTRTIKK